MENTITPLWECRSTYDICADIAEHLGMKAAFTEGRTQTDWMEHNYNIVRKDRPHLPPFKEVRGTGIVDQFRSPEADMPVMADFYRDPEANPLTTPSGKVEIYSAALQNLQDTWILPKGDRIPAVPEFLTVPDTPWDKPLAKKYPLQLTGFHTKGHTHSTYASVGVLKEAVPNQVWLNPLDAQERGIGNNDLVKIYNDRGTVMIEAKVTHRILPGVAAMPEGAWSVIKNGIDIGGCINSITSHRLSPLAKGNPQHTNLVEIEKA
ncbi:MAG: molybdopterin dinucleotide binding domain-containing protein [Vibrio sp.]